PDAATSRIAASSLHDALPISDLDVGAVGQAHALALLQVDHLELPARRLLVVVPLGGHPARVRLLPDHAPLPPGGLEAVRLALVRDRKSTRLNSSHVKISYAVF